MQITNKPSIFFKVSKYIRMSGFSKYSTVFYSDSSMNISKKCEKSIKVNFEREIEIRQISYNQNCQKYLILAISER